MRPCTATCDNTQSVHVEMYIGCTTQKTGITRFSQMVQKVLFLNGNVLSRKRNKYQKYRLKLLNNNNTNLFFVLVVGVSKNATGKKYLNIKTEFRI
jgi:hypothetical protein